MEELESQRGVVLGKYPGLPQPVLSQQIVSPPEGQQAPPVSDPRYVQPKPPYTNLPQEGFNPDNSPSPVPEDQVDGSRVRWSSPPTVHSSKNSTWYGSYVLAAIVLGAMVFLFTRDVISVVVIFIAAGILLYSGGHRPANLEYSLGEGFLQAGRKLYRLQDFRAFSIDQHTPEASITFWPLRRFMPPVTVFATQEQAQSIVEYIASYLPSEPHKNDAIDGILKRIRL